MKRLALSSIVAVACLAGCPAPKPNHVAPPRVDLQVKNVSLADVGLDAAAIDKSVDPCGDFYQFACGSWIKNTPIPADEGSWYRSFSEIHKRNEAELRGILESLATGAANADDRKLGDFYAACVDQSAVDKAGLGSVKPLLDRVAALRKAMEARAPKTAEAAKAAKKPGPQRDPKRFPPVKPTPLKAPQEKAASTVSGGASPGKAEPLERLLADLHRHGVFAFFSIGSGPDDKNATLNIAQMDQAGLGLPDRDYYLSDEPRFKEVREFYQGHVERMMQLGGLSAEEAKTAAADVLWIEQRIAAISKSKVERRDPVGMYNKVNRDGLKERSRGFDYLGYLDALTAGAEFPALALKSFSQINVTSVPFFDKLGAVISGLTPSELSHYLSWQILHATAGALPKAFDEESFKLQQKLTGQKEQKPRWKRCVAAADDALGELLGKAYVARSFSPESKLAATDMLGAIRAALKSRLHRLPWMDPQTAARADAKLAKMEYLIGYPQKWRAYPFEVDRASYIDDALRATAFDFEWHLAKIEKPVDRGEWLMTPPTVNAYYDPNKNHMVFPAGILQTPFFDPKAAEPVNMGAIGMVIGHEMTHGFDDQGAQYDGDGNLKNWWQPDVKQKFDDRAKCLVEQYGNYEVLPGVKQNGKLTLGENIADNAGLSLAYQAMLAQRQSAKVRVVSDGFDERQQLFLAVGQAWCARHTDAQLKLRATVDPHSNARWRVNGALANLPAFADAFHCQAGSPMAPAKRCTVW